jgi:hypothetical protein
VQEKEMPVLGQNYNHNVNAADLKDQRLHPHNPKLNDYMLSEFTWNKE